jgi:hypothetical protein
MDVLKTSKEVNVESNRLQSFGHVICGIKQTKKALTAFEDKRYWIDSIHSLPYGNKNIRTGNEHLMYQDLANYRSKKVKQPEGRGNEVAEEEHKE